MIDESIFINRRPWQRAGICLVGWMLVLPAIKEKLDALGTTTMISTPEQFSAMIKSEIALYLKVIKSANIRIE